MTPIFPELPCQLGEYTLTQLLELRSNTALYEARQTHVDRAVVLEVLTPRATSEEVAAFLAQSRLRVASSELPHVCHVFESLQAEGYWCLTQELPRGRSLAELTAEGQFLPIPQLCHVIDAAAEMYELCGMVDLSAMPLAPSSIYIEAHGEVHFLSPLVEGTPNQPALQMQALAGALWGLLPKQQVPGLGRASTLIQWLHEGYNGEWLPWNTIGETARTIVAQLETAAQNAQKRTLHYKLAHLPLLVGARQFMRQWGTYAGICATIIITFTCLGSLFGIADPVHLASLHGDALLCHQNGKNYRLMLRPFTVAAYARFLDEFEALSAPEQVEILEKVPVDLAGLEPEGWAAQRQQEQADTRPVTGVSYWQATLCAAFYNGEIPSANQLQLLHQQQQDLPCQLEWSSTEVTDALPGIYTSPAYLLIDQEGRPYPVNDRRWSSPHGGFRITFPDSTHP